MAMKNKNWVFRDCRSYGQFEQRAAEWLVYNDVTRSEYVLGDEEECVKWKGYCRAFRELFGNGDFDERVKTIRAAVSEVGVKGYHWGWQSPYF